LLSREHHLPLKDLISDPGRAIGETLRFQEHTSQAFDLIDF